VALLPFEAGLLACADVESRVVWGLSVDVSLDDGEDEEEKEDEVSDELRLLVSVWLLLCLASGDEATPADSFVSLVIAAFELRSRAVDASLGLLLF